MTNRARLGIALGIGILFGMLCGIALSRIGNGAGDFNWPLRAARDLLSGSDPYNYPPGPLAFYYPLPAAMLAVPLAGIPNVLAGGIFFGVSCGILAWLILRNGEPWQLLIFLSWPFFYALLYAQWTPLVLCLYFTPTFLPMLLVKPQIALPLALTQRPSRLGIGLTLALGIASLVIYPTWPWAWLGQTSTYQGFIPPPPLLVLPLGPLLLLALLRYRERKTWLLLSMAVMPQRVLYDQMALLFVAGNRREILALVFCSWISLPALMVFGGWNSLPGGWKLWILITLYLPALGVILAPILAGWVKQWRSRLENRN
jgi:hypothetical protein